MPIAKLPKLPSAITLLVQKRMGSIGAGEAKSMPNQCATNPAMTDPTRSAGWNGWGNDLGNTRFQPAAAARLTAADVPKLKVKWSFGFPKGETNNSQPTVVSGRVFAGGDNGYIYSLDAKTGCVYWSFQNGSIVRGSVTVGAVRPAAADPLRPQVPVRCHRIVVVPVVWAGHPEQVQRAVGGQRLRVQAAGQGPGPAGISPPAAEQQPMRRGDVPARSQPDPGLG